MNAKPSNQALLAALAISAFSAGGFFSWAKSPCEASSARGSSSAAELVAQGRNLYVQSCARCHGIDAKGYGEDDDGPNLHGLSISDARISSVVLKGVKGEMPSFAKKFSKDDVTSLIVYLRSLPADSAHRW